MENVKPKSSEPRLVEIIVPTAAKFVRSLFGWQDDLSQALATLDIENGRYFAFLSSQRQVTAETLLADSFQEDLAQNWLQIRLLACEFIKRYLQTGPDRVALFLSDRYLSDPNVADVPGVEYVLLKMKERPELSVCYMVRSSASDLEAVDEALERSRAFTPLVVLANPNIRPRHQEPLSPDHIDAVLRSTNYLIMKALDGSTYLIWSRQGNDGETLCM